MQGEASGKMTEDEFQKLMGEFSAQEFEQVYLGQGVVINIPANMTKQDRRKMINRARNDIFGFGIKVTWMGWWRVLTLGIQVELRSRALMFLLFGFEIVVGSYTKPMGCNNPNCDHHHGDESKREAHQDE